MARLELVVISKFVHLIHEIKYKEITLQNLLVSIPVLFVLLILQNIAYVDARNKLSKFSKTKNMDVKQLPFVFVICIQKHFNPHQNLQQINIKALPPSKLNIISKCKLTQLISFLPTECISDSNITKMTKTTSKLINTKLPIIYCQVKQV